MPYAEAFAHAVRGNSQLHLSSMEVQAASGTESQGVNMCEPNKPLCTRSMASSCVMLL